MGKVGVVICGVDDWERDIIPAIESIVKYERNVSIVTVTKEFPPDIYFDKFIPPPEYKGYNLSYIVRPDLKSYAQAINLGVEYFLNLGFSWLLIMNGDVLCTGKFVDYVLGLPSKHIFGNKVHSDDSILPLRWIDGWIYAIPMWLFEKLELRFDENFLIAGFEDADFCMQAFTRRRYVVGISTLPFIHLQKKVRRRTKGYNKIRKQNLKYLKEKWHELRDLQEQA